MKLAEMQTEMLKKDAKPLSDEEIVKLREEIPEWDLITKNNHNSIERKYKFKDFEQALMFTVRVGELAEKYNHHPAILTEWGQVTVTYWTHVIKGLHMNDFTMAAKTDDLYTGSISNFMI